MRKLRNWINESISGFNGIYKIFLVEYFSISFVFVDFFYTLKSLSSINEQTEYGYMLPLFWLAVFLCMYNAEWLKKPDVHFIWINWTFWVNSLLMEQLEWLQTRNEWDAQNTTLKETENSFFISSVEISWLRCVWYFPRHFCTMLFLTCAGCREFDSRTRLRLSFAKFESRRRVDTSYQSLFLRKYFLYCLEIF